jgi:hypothetical protein
MSIKITTNHEAIREWIEGHDGRPAIIRGSVDTLSGLSIVFGNDNALRQEMEEISWDEFFDTFESAHLSFRYSDGIFASGDEDLSYNFIDRESIPALDNNEFILPEENEVARENMFGSAPSADSDTQANEQE